MNPQRFCDIMRIAIWYKKSTVTNETRRKMYLNDIDFPNQILDAIQAKRLVVFAGAGASFDKPTSLPSFADLAKEIAEDTGKILKNEPCEVFLGALKADGVDVNGIAAKILSDACLKHNALHEAIVDLFLSPDGIRIVTTNYDQMFEQVLEEKEIKVPIYNSPALPLGDDVAGIIHIHGNVSDPKYMVVTDEDFGKAYLTEGYASRFLVKLFESYTVLFIGYSYNDTILRYLTRAMAREHSANRYILTDDTKAKWASLGISAIFFPKRSYAIMRNGIIKLGNYAKKALWDWKNQFLEIADNPPKDLTFETQIDYCLESVDRSKVLSNCVYGAGWLDMLDKKKVFSCCFSDSNSLDETGVLWANWLSNRFVGNDDAILINLFTKYGNRFSRSFAEILLRTIVIEEKRLDNAFLRKYITLLDQFLIDPWIIMKLIEITHGRQLQHLSLHLFKKLFGTSIIFEKSLWINGEYYLRPKHVMVGDYHLIKRAWDLIRGDVLFQYVTEILSFTQYIIEKVRYQYAEMDPSFEKRDPTIMSLMEVEDHEKEYSKDPFHVLVEAFLQAAQALENNEDARYYLKRGLRSKSVLFRKIALRAIRESDSFKDDEKIALIIDDSLVWSIEGKEQVFLLVKEAFVKVSPEMKNRLLDIIEEGPNIYSDNRSRQYEVYNWCVWLQRADPTNERVKTIAERIKRDNDFEPHEHPELSFVIGKPVMTEVKSPVTCKEMLALSYDKLSALLLNCDEDSFEGPSRWGVLNTFSKCVKENPKWAAKVIDYFYKFRIANPEIWNRILQGLEEANLSIEDAISCCEQFIRVADVIPDAKEAAHFLWKVLQREEMQKVFSTCEQVLFELSVKLWNRRDTSKPPEMRLVDMVFNTATGVIIMCWIYMVSYSSPKGIPEPYENRFEEVLQLKAWEYEVSVCILAGHYNFFCYRDRAWCNNHYNTMLTGKNKKAYISAWEGVVCFSRRISKDTADAMAPIYLKAVKNIQWLEGETRDGFIELYLTLLIFVVERPTLRYIPELYKYSTEEIRNHFVKAIGHRLRIMDLETKMEWWNSWLYRFIENRKDNKPVKLTDSECGLLYMLLPRLDFVFEEALKVFSKGTYPSSIDFMFWYELDKSKIAPAHSPGIIKLLVSVLNSVTELGLGDEYVMRIVASIPKMEEKEKKQLQEALLKHNLNVPLG